MTDFYMKRKCAICEKPLIPTASEKRKVYNGPDSLDFRGSLSVAAKMMSDGTLYSYEEFPIRFANGKFVRITPDLLSPFFGRASICNECLANYDLRQRIKNEYREYLRSEIKEYASLMDSGSRRLKEAREKLRDIEECVEIKIEE